MGYCALCEGAIAGGQRAARYYLPLMPERIQRAHLVCIEQERANATHKDLAPVVVA